MLCHGPSPFAWLDPANKAKTVRVATEEFADRHDEQACLAVERISHEPETWNSFEPNDREGSSYPYYFCLIQFPWYKPTDCKQGSGMQTPQMLRPMKG